MKRFQFEVNASYEPIVEAKNAEEARMKVIEALARGDYDSELSDASNYVSDGRELPDE
jgi:hypothetical protein